jgi:glutamate racemase
MLPHEDLVYLGDTARVPYGTKSSASVINYALQASHYLYHQRIKLLVIACNTATAAALTTLQQHYHPVPVIGVIQPGALTASNTTKNNHVAVIATESTIQSKAYEFALHHYNPALQISSLACPLFVPLVEEGWLNGPVVEQIIAHYLQPVFERRDKDKSNNPDCLVLGCTHFPLLRNAIEKVIGEDITIIDSAHTTANLVKHHLTERQLLNIQRSKGSLRLLMTDLPARFMRTARLFLDQEETANAVIEQVDLVQRNSITLMEGA